jgi:UDPglucose--hexose-1-phosphate uridylyltransferase
VSELRKDPITGNWVIIAPERASRPTDFAKGAAEFVRGSDPCPFCRGNEAMTPPAVLSVPGDGKPWEVRVFPNKFPALTAVGSAVDAEHPVLFERLDGVGVHEVIVETPDHGATLATLSLESIENVLRVYQARIRELEKDRRIRHVVIFKNHGPEAGATLEHGHSQLVALPIVPVRVREEVEGARAYFSRKSRCIYCDIAQQEEPDGKRLILKNEHFIAVAPYASRFPFEAWLLPRRHGARFEDTSENECGSLAGALKSTLASLDEALDRPPYHFIIHSAPFREPSDESYHWHIEIMPILSKVAGFEWGTGIYINPTPPEEAAQTLREIIDLG